MHQEACSRFVQEDPAFAPLSVETVQLGSTKPKVVFCDVKHPIYGLYVVVPTTILDNRGLPHTLEHLIFTGSRNHPNRGYLDKLATVCLSTGTNAYTCEDHTCYFVTTASFEGLLKLLPVYLDHILYPRLAPEDMALEVFSLDASKQDARGVVYCEMKSREHTEADQMDIRLRNYTYSKSAQEDPFLETYRWECGGASQRVSHLSPEEIRSYHKKFYKPAAVTIYVSGALTDDIKKELTDCLEGFSFEQCTEESFDDVLISQPLAESVPEPLGHFPADDESIGSIGFSWLGPNSSNLETVIGLHILMRALKETSASPLFQEFVECADPWASDIDYDVRGFKRTMITLTFSGVPNEDDDGEDCSDSEDDEEPFECKLAPGLVKEKMFGVFKKVMSDDEYFSKIVASTIKSFTLKIKEQYEEDPHELALGYCLPEILYGEGVGKSIATLPKILENLSQKPLDHWKDLMTEFLLENECHEAIMKPSKSVAETIKQAEIDNIKVVAELDRYPKNGAALLENFEESMSPVSLPVGTTLESKQTIAFSEDLSVQIVELPSASFSTVTIGFNLKHVLPSEDWKYLVIFQELLFQCDIKKPMIEGSILSEESYSYQDLQRCLSSLFTSYEAGVGLGNELFSASYLDSHLILTGTFPTDSKEVTVLKAVEMLLDVLKYSVFASDRIQVTVDNLSSQLSESKRDPSTVIEAVFYEQLNSTNDHQQESKRPRIHTSDHVSFSINIFEQDTLLSKLKEDIPESLSEKMTSISKTILSRVSSAHGLNTFVHVGKPASVQLEISEIKKLFSQEKELVNSFCFPSPEPLPRWATTIDPSMASIVVPMADVTAAFMGCSVLCPVLPVDQRAEPFTDDQIQLYLSLALLCHMLSFTEGPLYNRVRGRGLAYGAYLSLSLWNGLLSFDLNDSTAPHEAFETFLQLVRDVLQECDSLIDGSSPSGGSILCETILVAAKASFVYTNVSDRATPSSVFSLALRSVIRGGYPMIKVEEHQNFLALLQAMTLEQVAKAVRSHLAQFLDPGKRLSVTVLPPSMQEPFCAKAPESIVRHLQI